MDTLKELNTEKLDLVTGGGLAGDLGSAFAAVASAVRAGIDAGVGALQKGPTGSTGATSGRGIAPPSTWM
jgi:hypothetical protein